MAAGRAGSHSQGCRGTSLLRLVFAHDLSKVGETLIGCILRLSEKPFLMSKYSALASGFKSLPFCVNVDVLY